MLGSSRGGARAHESAVGHRQMMYFRVYQSMWSGCAFRDDVYGHGGIGGFARDVESADIRAPHGNADKRAVGGYRRNAAAGSHRNTVERTFGLERNLHRHRRSAADDLMGVSQLIVRGRGRNRAAGEQD